MHAAILYVEPDRKPGFRGFKVKGSMLSLLSMVVASLLALYSGSSVGVASASEASNIGSRILTAFPVDGASEPSQALKAAAWARGRGKELAAAVCLNDTPPRIGCSFPIDAAPRSVPTSPVLPWSGEYQTAFTASARLDGTWLGDGYQLSIDSEREQANIDPQAPFSWKRIAIKRISGNEVVFVLGGELFQAAITENAVTLKSTGFSGERLLKRT
jgi:hypothetical protein